MTFAILLLLAALVVAFLTLSGRADLLAGFAEVETGGLIAAGLLTLYVVFLLSGAGGRWRQVLGHLGIWIAIMAALVVGYAYREEVATVANRVAGEFLPPGTAVTLETGRAGEKAVRIRKRRDGHFVARSSINGADIAMLVDTGASTVVLKAADARRIGIDVEALSFSVPVNTANGMAYAAPVRLRALAIGPIEIGDVDALVAKPGGLNESLLGMSFLRRLRSFDFSGEFLTLRS